jgi:hypothetical protein
MTGTALHARFTTVTAGLWMSALLATSGVANAQSGTSPHILYTADRYSREASNQDTALDPGLAISTANMVYHGGPIMPTMAVYSIYWVPPGRSVAPAYQSLLNRYFQDVGGSALYRILTQYYQEPPREYVKNVSGLAGTWVDTTPYPNNGVSFDFVYDHDIQQEVQRAITANHWPSGGYDVMFFVFTASGVESCFDNGSVCTPGVAQLLNQPGAYCAYHSSFGTSSAQVIYANMPYDFTWASSCGTMNGFPNDPASDVEISTTSHEHFEAVTDPVVGTGWTDPDGGSGEIGDKCGYRYGSELGDGSNVTLNGHRYVVQQEWSNAAFNGSAFSGCALSYGSLPRFTHGDFDGDGKADITVLRPATGTWYIRYSATSTYAALVWGGVGDISVTGDYDGDGKADVAIFRPSTGTWYIRFSSTGGFEAVAVGAATDVPVPGDYDGDGITDIATFRPSTGAWSVILSASGTTATYTWGGVGDIPVPGDYDGDGITDIAVFRPSTGTWYVRYSSTGTFAALVWGGVGDIVVPGDYDGDGKIDIAIFRPSTGTWYVRYSGTGTFAALVWGGVGDIVVPGDYDGDGKTDIAVFRPSTGTWYIRYSATATYAALVWGGSGDIPIP